VVIGERNRMASKGVNCFNMLMGAGASLVLGTEPSRRSTMPMIFKKLILKIARKSSTTVFIWTRLLWESQAHNQACHLLTSHEEVGRQIFSPEPGRIGNLNTAVVGKGLFNFEQNAFKARPNGS